MQTNQVSLADYIDACQALPENSVDMILTDPPYGITANDWDVPIDLDCLWEQFSRIAKPNAAIVMTGTQPFSSALVMSNLALFRYEWVWLKSLGSDFLNANRKPFNAHESVLVFYEKQPVYHPQMEVGEPYRVKRGSNSLRKGLRQPDVTLNTSTANASGDRYPKSYQAFGVERGLHPTQKPTALFLYLILTYTKRGQIVFDPFCGSGTTAIAALHSGRQFICSDASPEYVGLTKSRIADYQSAKRKECE